VTGKKGGTDLTKVITGAAVFPAAPAALRRFRDRRPPSRARGTTGFLELHDLDAT
jgi:hypothetical protein